TDFLNSDGSFFFFFVDPNNSTSAIEFTGSIASNGTVAGSVQLYWYYGSGLYDSDINPLLLSGSRSGSSPTPTLTPTPTPTPTSTQTPAQLPIGDAGAAAAQFYDPTREQYSGGPVDLATL